MIGNSVEVNNSAIQNSAIMSYKIDTGSNRNIMPIHIFKILFLRLRKKVGGNANKGIVIKDMLLGG